MVKGERVEEGREERERRRGMVEERVRVPSKSRRRRGGRGGILGEGRGLKQIDQFGSEEG